MKSPDRDAADEIEHVARAICKADGYEPDSLSEPGERRNKLAWELYVHHAQEAVKASELATLRRRVDWQPMKTAPKDGTRLLLDGPGGVFIGAWLVEVGWHQTTGWVECGHDSPYIEASVKAWQPLTAPLPPGRNEPT